MIDIGKRRANVLAAACTISIAVIAVWLFRLFVISQGAQGVADMPGGAHRFWWAVSEGIVACVASYYVYSALVRYDEGNELTIFDSMYPSGPKYATAPRRTEFTTTMPPPGAY